MSEKLTRSQISEAFLELNSHLEAAGAMGEINLFGGTAMMLVFDARDSTRDVDAVFVPKKVIQEAIIKTALKLNLPANWINDGVKVFLSESAIMGLLPFPEFSHLRLLAPSPEYLLAMKCMAARVSDYETGGDRHDVLFLLKHLGIRDGAEVLKIVEHYYGSQPIHVKTRYFIEEVMEDLKKGDSP